jgi:hypothetical protein
MLALYAYVYLFDINPPKEIESGDPYWDHWLDSRDRHTVLGVYVLAAWYFIDNILHVHISVVKWVSLEMLQLLGVLKIVNLEPSRFMWSSLSSCGGGKQGVGVIHDHIPWPPKWISPFLQLPYVRKMRYGGSNNQFKCGIWYRTTVWILSNKVVL